GYALQAWVNAGPIDLKAPLPADTNWLIAYNGNPDTNGFGLFLHGDKYVARTGPIENVLGPAEVGVWHHLAYVKSLSTTSFYYDGQPVATGQGTGPVPGPASGGFWVGGQGQGIDGSYLFNGWIDEVRY